MNWLIQTQRNGRLLRDVDHNLFQTLHVANPVQDGDEEVQTLKETRRRSVKVPQQRPVPGRTPTGTGSRIRWKRPILSTTQASCWGTNRTTVFMGRLDAHRCWAGVAHNLGAVCWLRCRVKTEGQFMQTF